MIFSFHDGHLVGRETVVALIGGKVPWHHQSCVGEVHPWYKQCSLDVKKAFIALSLRQNTTSRFELNTPSFPSRYRDKVVSLGEDGWGIVGQFSTGKFGTKS